MAMIKTPRIDELKASSPLVLLLALAACGEPERAASPPTPEQQTAVDAGGEQAVARTMPDTPAADEQPQSVVEESAAEAEPGEQPLILARNDTQPRQQTFRYEEGKHYTRMVPTQTKIGGPDKIEVAEFFWYGCPHCYDLEPYIKRWKADKPANVRFIQVPVTWNNAAATHAKMFYTAEALGGLGVIEDPAAFHQAVFAEVHQRGNRLLSERAMQQLFARFGASQEDFDKAWNSFDVDRRMRLAEDLSQRYSIQSVPSIVVNGKFRTGAQEAGGNDRLVEVIDELIARESSR